jgi:hypothetical protein
MNDPRGKPTPAKPPVVYDPAEDLERWRSEYVEIRDLLGSQQGTGEGPAGERQDAEPQHEKRAEPRYAFVEGAHIFAHLGPKAFQIINISIGGVAFYSDISFTNGTKLLLSALGMIALDVEVLSCAMEEVDSDMMEYRYRVRAKFGPRVNGYQVYVLAREMYLQQIQEGKGGDPATVGISRPDPTR